MFQSPSASPIPRTIDPELEKKHQLEKQFHVKNIPAEWDEWKVFHAFREFGLVDDIRLPVPTQQSRTRYGFVTMCTYEDADKVRESIADGSLKVIEGVVFKVENVNFNNMRPFENKENGGRTGGYGARGFGQPRYPMRAPFANAKTNTAPVKQEPKPLAPQTISAGRLPVLGGVDVVMAPMPSNAPAKPFTFFVKEKNMEKDNRFLQMSARMAEIVNKQAPLSPEIANELTCAIVIFEQRPQRAQLIRPSAEGSPRMAYLVDEGKEIAYLPHAAWAMPSDVAIVPAKVCECSFAGTELIAGQESSIPSLRAVLEQITTKATLRLQTVFLEGRVNMVTARSIFVRASGSVEEADLVDGLAKKGVFRLNATAMMPRLYTREDMESIRYDCKGLPLDETISRDFAALKV